MIVQLYISELSKLAKVSKRTLHYYDKIGLLKPSTRLSNGYRLYSESDLLKLQQIVALKFFRFELSQIKDFYAEADVLDHLKKQLDFLEKKTKAYIQLNTMLKGILNDYNKTRSISWENVLQQIHIYQMNQKDKMIKVMNEDDYC